MSDYDYEIEWFLQPHEVSKIKHEDKTLIMLPHGIRFNTYLHANGLNLKVLEITRSCIDELSHDDLIKFGVRRGMLGPTCDTSAFHCWHYHRRMFSECTTPHKALKVYQEEECPTFDYYGTHMFALIKYIGNYNDE